MVYAVLHYNVKQRSENVLHIFSHFDPFHVQLFETVDSENSSTNGDSW